VSQQFGFDPHCAFAVEKSAVSASDSASALDPLSLTIC
jgi:hypothetical protein